MYGITAEMLKKFEYLDECVYSIELDDKIEELEGCSCVGSCSKEQDCACLKYCEAYTKDGKLVDVCENGILECTDLCQCQNCWNVLVQNPISVKIRVVDSGIERKGFQVTSQEFIPKGTFVAEYVGQVLSTAEARHKLASIRENQNNYLLCIAEVFNENLMFTFIDAEFYGNVSRFINHGCDPNLEIKLVRTGTTIPRFCLFAKRDIHPMEELCYDYGVEYSSTRNDGPPCHCGSENCREFRRIDTNSDNSLTFTEFLLGDQPYIETQSRNFHNLDANADGRVSREEFEAYYKQQDETHRRLRADGFFKQLSVKASQTGTGPIIINLSTNNDTILPKFFQNFS
uniref:Histone-lysine N-methyltransferase n=1 Tax=Panagrolaimus sp. JU765 TaxID=591449 RepID=A0AC34QGX7_9BILA